MRDIKFRAWDKKEKRMRDVVQVLWGSQMNPEPLSVDFYDSIKGKLFEDVELMQYTGLRDKNGVKIYEGDIVYKKVDGGAMGITTEFIGVIDFKHGEYICLGVVRRKGEEPTQDKLNIKHNTIWEVIGNIYENPELLK